MIAKCTDESKPKVGPYKSRTDALKAAKSDTLSITSGLFTLIKSRASGSYDYVPGSGRILMSDDIPQADYVKNKFTHEWMPTMRSTK